MRKPVQSFGMTIQSVMAAGFCALLRELECAPDVLVNSPIGITAIWKEKPAFGEGPTYRAVVSWLEGFEESVYSWELLDSKCRIVRAGGTYQNGWSTRVNYTDGRKICLTWGRPLANGHC